MDAVAPKDGRLLNSPSTPGKFTLRKLCRGPSTFTVPHRLCISGDGD